MNINESTNKRPIISLTPLIDVVFILLVFFMLASSFVEWNFIELDTGESEALLTDIKNQSIITVGFNESYMLNEESLPLDVIRANVAAKIKYQQSHIVLIKPVNDLPLNQLIIVLDGIGDVAGSNLSLIKD